MINDRIEQVIIRSLFTNESFVRRTLPFINPDYFSEQHEKYLIQAITNFIQDYNNLPTVEAISVIANDDSGISEPVFNKINEELSKIKIPEEEPDIDWLIDETEKFCQQQAIHNGIMSSVDILTNPKSKLQKGAIPDIMKDALSVSFNPDIGHDYITDSDERFKYYHTKEEKIDFDLDYMNRITDGGVTRKTLNVILAGTGVGKSLAMAHMAAANLSAGLNVLYITLELADKRIAERIDANLMNVSLNDIRNLPKDIFDKKIARIQEKAKGKLKIKEYPTSTANANHFRVLLNEYKLKANFVPDVIYIDYLNLCTSCRFNGANVNSYTYIKSIAEELRGLAVEQNIPLWTATQTTRSGYTSSDPGLEDTSESFGLPATSDFMVALISSEELEKMNCVMVKQLKNRYNDPNFHKRFLLGIDRSKMRLYDVDETAQTNIVDTGKASKDKEDTPAFDKSSFGEGMKAENTKSYDDWKF